MSDDEWDGSTPSETTGSRVSEDKDSSSGEDWSSKSSNVPGTVHPRFTCPQCQSHPDGFSMQRNRKRHIAVYHSEKRTFWRCQKTGGAGEIVPRSESCIQCKDGQKYRLCSNAARHLRRAHFNSKVRRKGKLNNEKKSRSRSRGGGWPPMDYLRQFMGELEENVS